MSFDCKELINAIFESGRYQHFVATFGFIDRGHYKDALPYLTKATDLGVYRASRDYLLCMDKIGRNFDEAKYLLDLTEKFKNLSEGEMQSFHLDTAFAFFKKRDIEQSLKYFTLAIEIDPRSIFLTYYHPAVKREKCVNIFQFLQTNVFPLVERKRSIFDENTLKLYDGLKGYHKQYVDNDESV